MAPCHKQGGQSSDLARESRLEVSLVKERPNAVVNIASELSLREKLNYLVGGAFSGTPCFSNLPSTTLTDTQMLVILLVTRVGQFCSIALGRWRSAGSKTLPAIV